MPKIVDHAEQRERIARAALRVIREQGLEGTTVRTIAVEAGMSVGSMRHYLTTQDDVFIFAMRLCAEQCRLRIEALPHEGEALDQLLEPLEQLLPLDPERHLEAQVWLAFVARAQNRPALRETLREMNDGLLLIIGAIFDVLIAADMLRGELRPARAAEAERLLATINGLCINALLWPETMTPQRQRALLRNHLRALMVDPPAR